jgi:hypothetical protein
MRDEKPQASKYNQKNNTYAFPWTACINNKSPNEAIEVLTKVAFSNPARV